MSHIHIPSEILLQILAHVRDNGNSGPNFHLDLLSCSMVSSLWFDCAWPLAAEFFDQDTPLNLDAYSTAQIGYLVDAITKSRQLRVGKTIPFTSVVTTINKLLFEQTARGSRADATMRLVHALQPPSKPLEIHIPDSFSAKKAANIQDSASELHSGTTSLHIFGGGISGGGIFGRNTSMRISGGNTSLRISGRNTSLRVLEGSTSVRISRGSYDFVHSETLEPLEELGNSEDIDPIVEQLAMNTPITPQLHNLIISLAPRLVRLVLPSLSTEDSDEFLALITSLDMPCLRHLDLSRLGDSVTAESVVQRHWVEGQSNPMSLLRWPKLQRINLRFCLKISPLFLQLVMASCPALEGVRLGGGGTCDFPAPGLGFEESEAILTDAGWTYVGYGFCGNPYSTEVTFSRPGRNVWESEEWVGLVDSEALARFGRRIFNKGEMDGVMIVSCAGIECRNELA